MNFAYISFDRHKANRRIAFTVGRMSVHGSPRWTRDAVFSGHRALARERHIFEIFTPQRSYNTGPEPYEKEVDKLISPAATGLAGAPSP